MKNNKGFVVSAVLYPLLVLFLALIMGILAMSDTRKRILDKMKLEISDSIFDEATCSCDTILNKLNYIIKKGVGSTEENFSPMIELSITNYETYDEFPKMKNAKNDIAIVSDVEISNYFVSDSEPTFPKQGTVWIYHKQSSPNSIVTETVNIPIAYIKQYINGEWILVDSAIYDGNNWKKLDDTEEETAKETNIQKGYTAIVNGKKITGTMNDLKFGFSIKPYVRKQVSLRGHIVSIALKKATETAEEDSLILEWENDNGDLISKNLCTIISNPLDLDDNGTGSVTDVDCKDAAIFQISPSVVGIIWQKATTVYKYTNTRRPHTSSFSEIEDLKCTRQVYLTTVTATSSTITTRNLQLNSDYNITANYAIDNIGDCQDGLCYSKFDGYWIDTSFDLKLNYNLFAGSYNESMVYFKINSTRNIETIYANQHSEYKTGKGNKTETCKRVESFAINKYTGVIEMYEDTSSVTRTIGHCVTKYENEKYGYSANTSSVFTNRGLAIMTYNNTMHDLQTKIDLYDVNIAARRTQATLNTSMAIDDTTVGQSRLEFTDEYEGTIRYLLRPKFSKTDRSVSLQLDAIALASNADIQNSSNPTIISGSPTMLNLDGIVPDDLVVSSYKSYYSKTNQKYYVEWKIKKGLILYVVYGINEINCNTIYYSPHIHKCENTIFPTIENIGYTTVKTNNYSPYIINDDVEFFFSTYGYYYNSNTYQDGYKILFN